MTFIQSSFEGYFEVFVGEILVLNSVLVLCQSVLWWNWEKEEKKKKKEHSTAPLCRSGTKYTNISSLQRPLVHFPVQSIKLGCLWAHTPDPIPATHADTCIYMCIHKLNLSSKVIPFGNDEWHFQELRCRENAYGGFPSGYETTIYFPRRYFSMVSIIFSRDGRKGTQE